MLSRTKNSLQLHFNQGDGDEDLSSEDERQHLDSKPLEPHADFDEPINSDFRRNILEKSVDGDAE